MKINEISIRCFAIEVLKKIDDFDRYDRWDLVKATIELLKEDIAESIFTEIAEIVPRKTLEAYYKKRRENLAEESEESDDEEEDNSIEVFMRLVNESDDDHVGYGRRSRSKAHIAIERVFASDKHRKSVDKIIEKIISNIEEQINGHENTVHEKLGKLAVFFKIDTPQVKFLELVYHETVNHKTDLGDLVGSNSDITEVYTGCTETESINWCSRSLDNPFVLKGLMKFGPRNKTILTDLVLEFINKDTPPDLTDMFLQKDTLEATFPMESFKQSELTKRSLINILKTNTKSNVLFTGLEGTGKTELAKTITKELGLDCYFLRPFNEKGSDSLSQRRMGLFAATSLLPNLPDSVLIVDEADKILATSRSGGFFSVFMDNVNNDEKAWTNQFLDQSTIRIIFITNKNSMDRSTLRRFNMILEFDALSSEQTASMVSRILDEKKLEAIERPELLDFIEENPGLNIGSYALAAQTAVASTDIDVQKEVFFQVLNSHHRLLGKSGSKRSLSKTYDENLLNLSMPIEKLTQAIAKFRDGKSHLKQLPMMFYGAPGTGKTELAHQLAKKFGMTLDIYGASDLLDPYVGMTEKHIAKAFKKASTDPNTILFIDEADSLFKSRASAEKSWMVSQTNELLRQMENYRGIFIAATNFNTLMDEAAMRRFHIKLEFRPLLGEKLLELYKMKFTSLAGDLDETLSRDLSKFTNLTPGDVHAVWSRLAYQEELTHPEIINELKREISFKQNSKKINLS